MLVRSITPTCNESHRGGESVEEANPGGISKDATRATRAPSLTEMSSAGRGGRRCDVHARHPAVLLISAQGRRISRSAVVRVGRPSRSSRPVRPAGAPARVVHSSGVTPPLSVAVPQLVSRQSIEPGGSVRQCPCHEVRHSHFHQAGCLPLLSVNSCCLRHSRRRGSPSPGLGDSESRQCTAVDPASEPQNLPGFKLQAVVMISRGYFR